MYRSSSTACVTYRREPPAQNLKGETLFSVVKKERNAGAFSPLGEIEQRINVIFEGVREND